MDPDRITQVAVYLASSVGATNEEREAVITRRWPGLSEAEFRCACDAAVGDSLEEAQKLEAEASALEAEIERRRRVKLADI